MKTIRLKQQLWQKQLQLENYVSPSAVSKVVKEQETNKQN